MDFLIIVSMLIIMFLLMLLYRKYRKMHYEVPARDISKGHRWIMVDLFPESTFCNISHVRIKDGAKCDSCGICVDDKNMKTADKSIACKPLSLKGEVTPHLWMCGNYPLHSKCSICKENCGVLPDISDFRCCYCKRTVHEKCIPLLSKSCDFDSLAKFIVPPHCVELRRIGLLRRRQRLIVAKARHPGIENWRPLIVVANRKSGNNDGEEILCQFRELLNPAQVIDLHDMSPENALEWCHLLPDVTFRVLVSGGDGTVGWVLDSIEKAKLKAKVEVCILPLGTGNDLARVLGWGDGHDDAVDVMNVLENINQSRVTSLDRWNICIKHTSHLGISRPKKTCIMNNYASIGVDALVTLNFHKQRKSRPWLFANRFLNKLCYFTYGTKDVLERECRDLHKKIKLELDGKTVSLTDPIEGIVVLNIASWGGGCRLWDLRGEEDQNKFQPARYDDGLLEVAAIYSSFHIAQLQVGLSSPICLGQAKSVKIILFGGNAPMQVDGEPWEQHPAEITITHCGKATMLERVIS
ncbi:hypothetical protein ACJMK2_034483 [Sinanodonta woodiana]|uniref:Diacylglycerol kinase n=1 Tax=Sinanodonta woodiana TaxID=1069815 RepID=A0ABD3WRS7_SINWO